MKVTFPTGTHITPGRHWIHTVRVEEDDVWFMGHLIETKTREVHEIHDVEVADPGMDGPPEDENSWPLRGKFEFADRAWIVVRDDDVGFWGFRDGAPLTRGEFVEAQRALHKSQAIRGLQVGLWDLDERGELRRIPQRVSIRGMERAGRPLMAHLLVELGIFKSVGEAKRNGWDRPLELGRHELGPKKNRSIVEIVE